MSGKMIPVRAKTFGQKPDGGFVEAGDEFEVPESKLSKLWHERLDQEAEAKIDTSPAEVRAAAKRVANEAKKANGGEDPAKAEAKAADDAAAKVKAEAKAKSNANADAASSASKKPVVDSEA